MELEFKGLNDRIRGILDKKFIFHERVAYVLALALTTKRNVWLYGEGGYGKSDMVTTVFNELGIMDETYKQNFGPGMTPEKIFGDIDLGALNKEDTIKYNTDRSFLAKEYAIFEEMADAAEPVLFQLKDPLERGEFWDGSNVVPMKTKTIIVCSNRSPADVAEYGKDAAALIQRWGLEEVVTWPEYGSDAYERLLIKRVSMLPGPAMHHEHVIKPLARLLSEASDRGDPIPPRIALEAAKACKGSATMAGRDEVTREDFVALRHVRGMSALGDNIEKEIDDALKRAAAATEMQAAENVINELVKEKVHANDPVSALKLAKKINFALEHTVSTLCVTDDLNSRKNALVSACGTHIIELRKRSEDLISD